MEKQNGGEPKEQVGDQGRENGKLLEHIIEC